MKTCFNVFAILTIVSIALLGSGCQAFFGTTREVAVDEPNMKGAAYDRSDFRTMPDQIARELLDSHVIAGADKKPIVVILGIDNETDELMNMRALADSVRDVLLKSHQVRFVNATARDKLLKEQKYEAKHVTPEQQKKIKAQLGADLMLTGVMIKMTNEQRPEARISKKKEIYYKLTVDLTDLETNELLDTANSERAREESKPMIRW